MSDESNKKLCVKIVNVDYYLTKPISELKDPCYSGFKSLPIYNVPVIRIFGPTSEGVKTCAHIHGVFPYIFIPNWNNEIEEKDLYQFAINLDRAINTSFAYSSSKTSHVYRISKVSGKPFYGYHESEKQFLKIEFYNPAIVKRATDLLQNGSVYNMPFQPYEAHVPYILQFFIDHNLYGMSYVILSSYSTRDADINNFNESSGTTNSTYFNIPKQSYCNLEVDISVCDIINVYKNSDDMPNNPGLAFIWEEEKKRRRLQSRVSQITPNISQNRPQKEFTRTELYFKTKLTENLSTLKTVNSDSPGDVSQVSEMNSSYEELNTQSRSILSLLEKLVNPSDVDKKDISPASSPSIVCSDDEGEVVNLSFLSSQPLLKLPAENDSILGDNFSDNEVDDDDHLTLSRSLARRRPERSFSSDDSSTEHFDDIPQLDGADGISPPRSRSRRNTAVNKGTKKVEAQGKRPYNLRSKKKESISNIENNDPVINGKAESKTTPKKHYPQLQIDTQKSPKSSGIRLPEEQKIIVLTDKSPRSVAATSETLGTINVLDNLRSPSTTGFRNVPSDEGRKSETKRPYPQLEVNIRKSPRTVSKNEDELAKARKIVSTRLKKRKINFDELETKPNVSDLFNISLMTARWKKQRVKVNKETNDGSDSCKVKSESLENSSHSSVNNLKKLIPGLTKNETDGASVGQNITHTYESDINSQKYSLGIRFNSDDLDHRILLESLYLKKPVVMLQRITDIDAFKLADDGTEGSAKHKKRATHVNVETVACSIDEKSASVVENIANSKTVVEGVGSSDCFWEERAPCTNVTHVNKNSEIHDVVTRRSKRNMERVYKKTKTDINEIKSNLANAIALSDNDCESLNELQQSRNSLKRKRLGMRMSVRNKNNVNGGNKLSETVSPDMKKNSSELIPHETMVNSSNMHNFTGASELIENFKCDEADRKDKVVENGLFSKHNLRILDVRARLKEETATQKEDIFVCSKRVRHAEEIETADVSKLIFSAKSESSSSNNCDPDEIDTVICSFTSKEDEKFSEFNLRVPDAAENCGIDNRNAVDGFKNQKSELYGNLTSNEKIMIADEVKNSDSLFYESDAKLQYQCSDGSSTNYDSAKTQTIVCSKNTDGDRNMSEFNSRVPRACNAVDRVVQTIIKSINLSSFNVGPVQISDVKSESQYWENGCTNYDPADVQTIIYPENKGENVFSEINVRIPGIGANNNSSAEHKKENDFYLASSRQHTDAKKSDSQYSENEFTNYDPADVQTVTYSENVDEEENVSEINLRIRGKSASTSDLAMPESEHDFHLVSSLRNIDIKKSESQYSENAFTNYYEPSNLQTVICSGNSSEIDLRIPKTSANAIGHTVPKSKKPICTTCGLQTINAKKPESQNSENMRTYYSPAEVETIVCTGNTAEVNSFSEFSLHVPAANPNVDYIGEESTNKNCYGLLSDVQALNLKSESQYPENKTMYLDPAEMQTVICSVSADDEEHNVKARAQKTFKNIIDGSKMFRNDESSILGYTRKKNRNKIKTVMCSYTNQDTQFNEFNLCMTSTQRTTNVEEMRNEESELFSPPNTAIPCTKDVTLPDNKTIENTNVGDNLLKFNVRISQNDKEISTSVNCIQNSQEVELFSQPNSNPVSQKSDENVDREYVSSSSDDKKTKHDSTTLVYDLNSDDDVLFCELNTQPPTIADSKCVTPPKTEATTRRNLPNADVVKQNVNIKVCEGLLRIDRVKKKANVSRLNFRSNFDFNNSIWDSVEDERVDEEGIKSFYDESPSSVGSRKTDCEKSSPILKLSSENDKELFDDETDYEKSSPVAKILTLPSDDGIMSFYDYESPIGSIVLLNDEKLSDAETDFSSQNKNDFNSENHNSSSPDNLATRSVSSTDGSPICVERSKNVLHSTPQQRGKPKKSPSPTYTPILKKLMLKKFIGNDTINRRRISSQRFQSEPFLMDIKEEEVLECDAKDTSMSLPMNISKERSIGETKIQNTSRSSSCSGVSGQIDVTLGNTYGFRMDLENLKDVKANAQYQYITVMSLEIFVETREDLNPDPEFDPIRCLFYSIFQDAPNTPKLSSGVIIVDNDLPKLDVQRFTCEKMFVENENELFDHCITLVRKWDPDIFIGYEVEMLSWGYFIQRGQYLNRHCDVELSRIKDSKAKEFKEKTVIDDSDYSSEFKLVGRIVLNVWRLMRHEIALQSYSFENMVFHVLHQRVSQHSFQSLTQWWKNPLRRWIVIDYYLFRTENSILLLEQLDFFGRTSELARLFGIQFYEVLSRGSQFRVESMMLRLAKTQNFVAVSPSPRQRASMSAPGSLPLIMEPESKFYTDPVIVLDFQSLYPSIIIAYNYCFSTCLGKVEHLGKNEVFNFGCIQHTIPTNLLLNLESSLNFSPCGVAFVNKDVRKGILPSMLEEILETRLMVKKSMKENKNNNILQRVLHARQLGLKLIANVTYGYTSANFSGRMPCIEIGDSVVSKGRETLERAIEMVSNTEKWGARVIYGDTDSIFVMVPNRTKEEAFRIGNEIVEAVTNDNPKPVKLKLEKVYYPCILQTKKRYVGYMYESADQKEPTYDAKGIETVRRDGCPAVCKVLEKSLKLLFESKNIDVVKRYVQRQFIKLISGRLSIQELTFAREYRGMHNYRPAACVPALQLARQALLKDRRSEPRVKERVRFVIVAGPPGVPLIRMVRTPQQFLENPGSVINAEYYITRAIIPALERCFLLMNVNVQAWYTEIPRKQKLYLPVENDFRNRTYKKKTISHYFASSKCVACQGVALFGVCKQCEKNPQQLAIVLGDMINSWQRKHNYISKICRSCCGRNDLIECTSLDCPIFYSYHQTKKDIEQVPYIEELQYKYLHFQPANKLKNN